MKAIAARDGEAWFELTPKSQDGLADTQFSQLRLGFANDVLVAMELVDAFDQTTLIRFSDLRRNGRCREWFVPFHARGRRRCDR